MSCPLGTVEEYNARFRSLLPEKVECSLALDCACGPVADLTLQIFNPMGADLLALNIQMDSDFVIGKIDRHGICTDSVRRQVESDPGFIGCSMNRIGTMTAVLDEKKRKLSPEQVFALTVMFLKPKRMAVLIDTAIFVDDTFHSRLDDTEPENPKRLVMTEIGVAAICETVTTGDELEFYDKNHLRGHGRYVRPIHTAAVMEGMAGNKSINRIVDGFPKYLRDREVCKCQCPVESFRHSVDEAIHRMERRAMVRTDA